MKDGVLENMQFEDEQDEQSEKWTEEKLAELNQVKCDKDREWNLVDKSYTFTTYAESGQGVRNVSLNVNTPRKQILQYMENDLGQNLKTWFAEYSGYYTVNGTNLINFNKRTPKIVLLSMLHQNVCRLCVGVHSNISDPLLPCAFCLGYSHRKCVFNKTGQATDGGYFEKCPICTMKE